MVEALQVVGSFFAAALGWVTLEFIGRPLRKFFDLRGEVIRRLTEYANVRAQFKEIPDDPNQLETLKLSKKEIARLEEAQKVFRDLASQMDAFAQNETCALFLVGLLRYRPAEASACLIGLSNSYDTYGRNKAFQRRSLHTALRIKQDDAKSQLDRQGI